MNIVSTMYAALTEEWQELLRQMQVSNGDQKLKRLTVKFAAMNFVNVKPFSYATTRFDHGELSGNSNLRDALLGLAVKVLEQEVSHWTDGHGSFGSVTFDSYAKSIRVEINLLGPVQTSVHYPAVSELTAQINREEQVA